LLSLGLRVPKRVAAEILRIAKKYGLLQETLRVSRLGEYVHIPIRREPIGIEFAEMRQFSSAVELVTLDFELKQKPRGILEELESILPPHLLALVPRSFDQIGDIVVVEIPSELKSWERLIGEAILRQHRNACSVFAKESPIHGDFRLRSFRHIAGENRTVTVHKENGCVFELDISKVYFSPRLGFERARVASQVKSGETVLDMFAGVGPFTVQVARTGATRVYAIELNPDAYIYLQENILRNKVVDKVVPILGDARRIVEEKLTGIADRIIMNLPESAKSYVKTACKALRTCGGVIHYYSFESGDLPLEKARAELTSLIEAEGRKVKGFYSSRIVKEVAPREFHIGLDVAVASLEGLSA
jgi:tRNA (guanine37-N1)-methyltransferase